MNVLIDYVTVSFKIHCIDYLLNRLGLDRDKMESIRSFFGYTYCLYYAGVQIHYLEEEYTETDKIIVQSDVLPRRITSVILNISGKGCRTIESLNPGFDWFEFFYQFNAMIQNKDAHFARLDLACDDTDGILDIKQILRYTERYQFVCKSKCDPMVVRMREEAAYFGSPKSDRRLRIYNKALEQGIDAHWIRCEMQLRNDNATSLYLNYINGYRGRVGAMAAAELNGYLRFFEVPKGMTAIEIKAHDNAHRYKSARWWLKFVATVETLRQLHLPGNEYTYEVLSRYVRQTHSSVKTFLELNHGDVGAYLDEVYKSEQSTKQVDLIRELLRRDRE